MKSSRILIITGTTRPTSGLGRYSKEIVDELRKQGEHVTVLAISGQRDITLLSHQGTFSLLSNIFITVRAAQSADIIHALDAWPFAIYGLFAVLGRKKVLYINGVGSYSVPPKGRSMKRFLMVAAYRLARHVFSISLYTQERIRERLSFARPMSIVHLATTPLPLPDAVAIAAIRERYLLPADAQILLTVGEIKDRKGQLDTLRAVLESRKKNSKLIYIMVGHTPDASYIDEIKKDAREQKDESSYRIVSDASSDLALAAWYSIANILVLASNNSGDHFEGFGLVFLEAAQFGVPGVGTRGCGIEDAIVDGSTGLLVPQRDPEALQQAIKEVLVEHERFSAAAIAFASHFSWQKTVEAYRTIYYT